MTLPFASVNLRSATAAWRAFSISFANQAISSGTNLLLTLLFVRMMGTTAFGLYGIAISVVLLFSGIGNALILTQMVVHFPDAPEPDKSGFLGRTFLLVCGLSGIAILAGVVSALVLSCAPSLRSFTSVALATAGASVAYLAKDFFLRASYSLRCEAKALQIVVAVATGTALAATVYWSCGAQLSAAAAVGIYGFGQMTGAAVGAIACRTSVRMHELKKLGPNFRQFFVGGRWALGGVLTTWLHTQAYVYVTAMFVGPAGVAYANAGRVFVAPLQLMLPAVNQVTMPRLASLWSKDSGRLAAAGASITRSVLLIAILYLLMLCLGYRVAEGVVLGDKYRGIGFVVLAWSVLMLMQVARDGASTILQVTRNFRRITVLVATVACFTLPLAALLAKPLGALGPMVATIVGELLLAIALWRAVKHEQCPRRSQ